MACCRDFAIRCMHGGAYALRHAAQHHWARFCMGHVVLAGERSQEGHRGRLVVAALRAFTEVDMITVANRQTTRGMNAVVVVVASLFLARIGSAQTPSSDNAVNAKLLQYDATRFMQAKDYRRACPKLAEAAQLAPSAFEITMALATCYEYQDKLATAWKTYIVAMDLATQAGQTSVAEQARGKVDALESKLARLTLQIPLAVTAIPNVSVRVGSVLLQESTWGAAIPVDRGSIEVTVQAPGYNTRGQTVTIARNGEAVTVNVEVPTVAKKQTVEKSTFVVWTPGLVIAGVGVVGVVAGTLSGVAAISNKAIVDVNCVNHSTQRLCNANGIAAIERTDRFALLSTLNLSIGFGALTTGIVLLAIKGKPPEKSPATANLQVDVVGPWGTGFGLRGGF